MELLLATRIVAARGIESCYVATRLDPAIDPSSPRHSDMEIANGEGSTKVVLEAQAHVWNHTFNYITSMSLKCAVQLGIPDIISNHGKPITLRELVDSLSISGTKSSHIHRLMRILVHSGFFSVEEVFRDQEERYWLTASSKLLLKNCKENVSPFLLMILDPFIVTPFHSMSEWFHGSLSSPFETAHGMKIWDYCGKHSDANTIFNAAMASDAEFVMSVMLKDWKSMFEGFESLVDVGGGIGTVAKAISETFSLMKCTVLDLPHVVSNMKGSNNLEFVGGDMFKSVPYADIILLKWIMHDWSDEECVQILKRCKDAIRSTKGKVIIIDMVLDDKKGKYESIESQLCFDMLMLTLVTGKERNENEWDKLFLEAGFTSYKITHGMGLRSIIEVFP